MNVWRRHMSLCPLARPLSRARRADRKAWRLRGACAWGWRSLRPGADGGLTWFLRYQALDSEPLPGPGAQYVKFRDSSSRTAEASSSGPVGTGAAMGTGSALGLGCRASPPAAPPQPQPLPAGRATGRGHLAPKARRCGRARPSCRVSLLDPGVHTCQGKNEVISFASRIYCVQSKCLCRKERSHRLTQKSDPRPGNPTSRM